MIEFFLHEKNITDKVINYSINYHHQWYPGAYIVTHEKLLGNGLMINTGGNKVIFYGWLEKIIEEHNKIIYFFIYPSSGLKIAEYQQYWYNTWSTQGGYFSQEKYKINPILWNAIDDCFSIINHQDILYSSQESIPKKSPQFNIQYKYPLQYEFKITKIIEAPIHDHNKIMDILENFQNHQIKISSMISQDNHIIINYIHNIHYEIEENLIIKYNNYSIHQPIDIVLTNDLIKKINPRILSSLDGSLINKIITQYHGYMNFDTLITLKFYGLKDFFVGQAIEYNGYKGFIINITIENFYNDPSTTIVIKSYNQWNNMNFLPNYPKTYDLNEKFIQDQWKNHWKIVLNENIQCTLPHINVIYETLDHENIIIS